MFSTLDVDTKHILSKRFQRPAQTISLQRSVLGRVTDKMRGVSELQGRQVMLNIMTNNDAVLDNGCYALLHVKEERSYET